MNSLWFEDILQLGHPTHTHGLLRTYLCSNHTMSSCGLSRMNMSIRKVYRNTNNSGTYIGYPSRLYKL